MTYETRMENDVTWEMKHRAYGGVPRLGLKINATIVNSRQVAFLEQTCSTYHARQFEAVYSHLILLTTLQDRYCFYLLLQIGKQKQTKINDLPKVPELMSGGGAEI